MDFEDLKAKAKPAERTADLCLDRSLAAEHDRLERTLAEVRQSSDSKTLAGDERAHHLAEEIQSLEDRMANDRVTFRFRELSNRRFTALVDQHPPREKNARDEDRGFNWETFPPAIICETAVDPVMTLEQADELFHDLLCTADADMVLDAVLRGSVIPSRIPFSALASLVLRGTEPS